MRLMYRAILSAAFLLCSAAADATITVREISGNPLRIRIGSDTSFQVFNSQVPGSGQIFPSSCQETGDSGVFARVGGTLFGPDFSGHTCGSAVSAAGSPWTQVSLSAVSGSGTATSPFTVVVTVNAGNTGVRLTETITYVNGENFFRKRLEFSGGAQSITVFVGADIYLASSDNGVPVRLSGGAVGGRDCQSGAYNIFLVPITPASAFTASGYSSVWGQIAGAGLNNSVATGCLDNGAALQWNGVAIPAGGGAAVINTAVSFGTIPTIAEFRLDSLQPDRAQRGADLRVTASGIGFQTGMTFNFGDGITIRASNVISPTSATVDITVAANAPTGVRSVTARQSAEGPLSTLQNAFSVQEPCTLTCTATAPAQAIRGAEVLFQATALLQGDVCLTIAPTFLWTFHDGQTAQQNPVKVYEEAGTFSWSMTASVPGLNCTRSGSIVVTPGLPSPAAIAVVDLPKAIVQPTSGGGTATFAVQNVGGSPTEVTLTQSGSFFSQTPTRFTLGAGATQVVTVTGLATEAGSFEGSSILSGVGVPPGLTVRIRVFSTTPPSGPVIAAPAENRVDIVSSTGGSPSGTASFINRGNNVLQGVLSADVPWLIPQGGIVTIQPGQTVTVSFTIDSTRRPDGEYGSATGNLILTFLNGTAGKIAGDSNHGTGSTAVAVVHTVTPGTAPGQIPPVAAGEVALFMPGVAHVPGSVGTFLSDVSLTNLGTSGSLTNVNLLFTPRGSTSTLSSTISQIVANRPLLFGDVARTVFNNTTSVGTLQVRSTPAQISNISASANVFNISNPQGTYGTAIPVFRSDRSAGPAERIFLTGLRADATTHTNLYIQETAGQGATVTMDFYDAQGVSRGGRNEVIGPFGLLQLGSPVPLDAVSAVLTNAPGSTGRVAAYATPVDRASGDTWAVADWRRQYAAAGGQQVVPVAATVRGANNTHFRTDLAILNSGSEVASGTLRFYSRTGQTVDRALALAAFQSSVVTDVLTTMFNLTGDQVGYLLYIPTSGTVTITSRTYTTVSGQVATFGTGVPTIPADAGLRAGQRRRFGGIEDSSLAAINSARGGTFRTNVGIVEIAGQPVTVRVTLRFTAGTQASAAQAVVTKDYALAARQFFQINGITRDMVPNRDANYGDLRNMQLDVQVLSGAGAVVVYTSSVDNGTGDSILRVD
jgi:hypothetical protein